MREYYIYIIVMGDDGLTEVHRVTVSLPVLRAYGEDARRLYKKMRGRGECECGTWQRCDGDCHLCAWYRPSADHDWSADLSDAVRHARGEYGASAEDVVMQRLVIELVLAALNDTQREVIMLAADGLSNAEIARVLGISRKRVYRARLRAREIGRKIVSSN